MKTRIGLALALALLGAAQRESAAAGGAWGQSFGAAAVASYLEGKPRLLVAAAGEDMGTEAEEAAAALRGALKHGGTAALVMDSAALGEVITLDDQAIVKKAGRLPIDVIAVVRVFEGQGAPSAVVTFYDKKGGTLSALNVQRGQALTSRTGEEQQASTRGVSAAAASSVEEVLRTNRGEGFAPAQGGPSHEEQEFARRRIGFYQINVFHFNQYGYVGVSTHLGNPFLGQQQNTLDWTEFFKMTGHPDEERYYRRRGTTKVVLMAVGGSVALVGLGVGLGGAVAGVVNPRCNAQDSTGQCTNQDNSPNVPAMVGGAVLFAGGLVALFTGAALGKFKSDPRRLVGYAVDYNRDLRKQLGLPPAKDDEQQEHKPESRGEAPRVTLSLVPTGGANAGGLLLLGRF